MKTIAYVTTCKGRLHHLRQTLPLMLAHGAGEVIVVDYGCPDNAGDWAETHFPAVRVIRVNDDPGFCLGRARNIGAAHTDAEWLAFVDADIIVSEGWNTWMQQNLQPGHFYRRGLVNGIRDADTHGTAICTRADFEAIGGYDELYRGWGGEDEDLYQRLLLLGVTEQAFPCGFVTPINHGDEERAGWSGLRSKRDVIDLVACYRLAKMSTLQTLGLTGELPLDIRTQFMENTRRELVKWFDAGRATQLALNYELIVQGRPVKFTINLDAD